MARNLDGTDDQIEGASVASTVVDNFTIGGWFYFENLTTDDDVTFYNGNAGADGWGLYYQQSTGLMTGLFGGVVFGGGGAISTGTWLHLVLRRTAGTGQVFQNAATLGDTWTDAPNTPTGTNITGGSSTVSLPKRAAELFIYEVALSTPEIEMLYNGLWPLSVRPNALKLYRPLYGTTSPEPDFSGNGNSGTVTGATAIDHPPRISAFRAAPRRFFRVPVSVFSETVQAGPVVLLPSTVRDILSATDKRQAGPVVLVPADKDMGQFSDKVQAISVIVPSSLGTAAFKDTSLAATTVVPSPADRLSALDKPAVVSILLPSERDLAAFKNAPQTAVALTPSPKDTLSAIDKPQVGPVLLIPSTVSNRSLTESLQAGALVLLPSTASILSAVDKPQVGPLVLVPSDKDLGQFGAAPSAAILVTPAVKDIAAFIDKPHIGPVILLPSVLDVTAGQFFETVQATIILLPAALSILSGTDKPQLGPVVITPSPKDIAVFQETGRQVGPITLLPTVVSSRSLSEAPPAVPVILTTIGTDRAVFVDRPQVGAVIVPSGRDFSAFGQAAQIPVTLLPTARDRAVFTEGPHIGPVILLTSVLDSAVRTFLETVQATIVFLPSGVSNLAGIDRPQLGPVIITPAAKDVAAFQEPARQVGPTLLLPTVQDRAVFTDQPRPIIVVLPSGLDTLVGGGGLFETVTAIIRLIPGLQDAIVLGPFHSAGGRSVIQVSGRDTPIEVVGGRIIIVSARNSTLTGGAN